MSGRNAFVHQEMIVHGNEIHGGFTHLVGDHALKLVQMVHADRNKEAKKRELLDVWKNLGNVNDRWIGLLCKYADSDHHDDYRTVCSNLVNGYTESIGDYILEGACHGHRVEKLTKAEGTFYGALNRHGERVTKQQWIQYTNALVDYVKAVDRYGMQSDHTWGYAADVLVAGRMLGNWLDQTVLRK